MKGCEPVMADTLGFNIYANAVDTLACCTGVDLLQYLYVSPYTLRFYGQSRRAEHLLFSLQTDQSAAKCKDGDSLPMLVLHGRMSWFLCWAFMPVAAVKRRRCCKRQLKVHSAKTISPTANDAGSCSPTTMAGRCCPSMKSHSDRPNSYSWVPRLDARLCSANDSPLLRFWGQLHQAFPRRGIPILELSPTA